MESTEKLVVGALCTAGVIPKITERKGTIKANEKTEKTE